MKRTTKNPCHVCGFAFKNWRHSPRPDGPPAWDDKHLHEFLTKSESKKWIALFFEGDWPDSAFARACVGPFDDKEEAESFARANRQPDDLYIEVVEMCGRPS